MEKFQGLLRHRLHQKKKQPNPSKGNGLFGFGADAETPFMSNAQALKGNFKDLQASNTQQFAPGTFKEGKSPYSVKGYKPEPKAKKNSINSKLDTPGPLDGETSSDDDDSAKRRYANLNDEDRNDASPFE